MINLGTVYLITDTFRRALSIHFICLQRVSLYIKQQEPHLLLQVEVWLEKGGHQLINPARERNDLEIPSEGCPTHRPFVLSFLRHHFQEAKGVGLEVAAYGNRIKEKKNTRIKGRKNF